jgi:hypothetical protein
MKTTQEKALVEQYCPYALAIYTKLESGKGNVGQGFAAQNAKKGREVQAFIDSSSHCTVAQRS